MNETEPILSDKMRWLIFGVLAALIILFISLLLPPAEDTRASAASEDIPGSTMAMYDSPNAITAGMSVASYEIHQAVTTAERAVYDGCRSVAAAVVLTGSIITEVLGTGADYTVKGLRNGAAFVTGAVSSSAAFTAHAVSSGVAAIVNIPSSILGFAADTAIVGAVIRPADGTPVAVIEPALPIALAARTALPVVQTASRPAPQIDSAPAWPIRGEITTLFGVPHWPYQQTHTGLDISDGKPSGITPIMPFRPGRVIETVHSNYGLGNYVLVDHGEGITSLYGHLASINVQTGQMVDKNSVLGYEGSTGASTGTHLHLEIRVHGQPADPRQFISGRP